MEIKTAFATIVGILMMVTVTVATVVIMGGLTQISVEECKPVDYKADRNYDGSYACGSIDIGAYHYELYCKYDSGNEISDYCFDESKGLCCPVHKDDKWEVKVANGHCCNNTKL